MSKTKIIIAGIGGVGGYFGGLLAHHYDNHDHIEINFIARGAHLEEIRKNGLKVIQGGQEFIAKPHLVTDNPAEIGIADFIVIATKSYDLETIIQQLQICINQDTIILPLLNGVDSRERIKKILPANMVLDGCVYIVSRLKQVGVVENIGNIQTLYFGLDHLVNDRLHLLENLLKRANIEASLSTTISTIIWEKYIFISPTATATSYLDKCIGELLSETGYLSLLTQLIEEVIQIALANQIAISEHIAEKTINKLKGLPFSATSSMHSDFKNNNPKNELQSLTAYVINQGRKYNLETPTYIKAYDLLMQKSGL
ncbi:MAG: 2-dehydropantoate 2-reductase [Saprospiraceae bacterium]|nr:2-dehydropantoate 2-reductase [Saprospiraceae bacterium]